MLKSVLPTQPVDKMEETSTQVRRTRTAFTNVQLMELEKEFEKCIYLHRSRRIDISKRLSLNETHVKVWFQNRRMKIKRAPIIANGNKSNTSSLTEDVPKENVIPKKPIASPRDAKIPISSMPNPVQYQQFPQMPSTVNHTKPLIELYQIIPTPSSAFQQYQLPPQVFEHPQPQFYENDLNLPATQVFFQPNHQYQSQQYWNQYQFHQTNQEQLQQYQQQFQQYYQSQPIQTEQVQFQPITSSSTNFSKNSEVSTTFDSNIYEDVHKPAELPSVDSLDLSEFLKFNKPLEKMEEIQIKEEPKDELFDILEEIYKSGLQDERQQLSTSLSESINSFEASNNFTLSEIKSENLNSQYEDISFDEDTIDPQTSINNLSFDQVHQSPNDFS
uniref:Zerknuellt 7 n=1 Tax=Episyrphus balteatus TaxID=286459 RepID=B5M6Y7_EPIBA|nr:zerknuellt 7 [Episyrphus balteatus]